MVWAIGLNFWNIGGRRVSLLKDGATVSHVVQQRDLKEPTVTTLFVVSAVRPYLSLLRQSRIQGKRKARTIPSLPIFGQRQLMLAASRLGVGFSLDHGRFSWQYALSLYFVHFFITFNSNTVSRPFSLCCLLFHYAPDIQWWKPCKSFSDNWEASSSSLSLFPSLWKFW